VRPVGDVGARNVIDIAATWLRQSAMDKAVALAETLNHASAFEHAALPSSVMASLISSFSRLSTCETPVSPWITQHTG